METTAGKTIHDVLKYRDSFLTITDTRVYDMPLPAGSKRSRNAKNVGTSLEPKIQRNEPCPCNSGKKYKKCCLLTQEAQ